MARMWMTPELTMYGTVQEITKTDPCNPPCDPKVLTADDGFTWGEGGPSIGCPSD